MDDSGALTALAHEYWEHVCETGPTSAMLRGDHRFDDRMEDISREAEDDDIRRLEAFAAAAVGLDATSLSPDERLTRRMLEFLARNRATALRARTEEMGVNHTIGRHIMLFNVFPQLPLTEADHAEALVAKVTALGGLFDQSIERLRQGRGRGRVPMASTIARSIGQIEAYLGSDVATDPFLAVAAPPDLADAEGWRKRLEAAVTDTVRPAYARFRGFLADELLTYGAPDDAPGLVHLPGGLEDYARLIGYHTTLDLDAGAIHSIGLEAVAELAEEYRRLGAEVLGVSDLGQIFARLRDDPDLHYGSAAEVVEDATRSLSRAWAALPGHFGLLPAASCRIEETDRGPLAFYFPPAADGSRPGTFFVNISEPGAWGRFEMEAIAFHEGVPGHHLQIAVSQELDGIPEFRKHAYINAYTEGWGLYSERLADEMGLYSSGLTRIGMLAADSLRATRLVVDTGLHHLGWSREQAIAYMVANSPLTRTMLENEVDRYVGMPGQALGYMIGRREIMGVRDRARAALGDAFEPAAFHDVLLGSGEVPLPVLGELVDAWIDRRRPDLHSGG